MRVITYSLRSGRENAEQYYLDASVMAEDTIRQGLQILDHWIRVYKEFAGEMGMKDRCTDEEYVLELLTLGVLWLRYSDDAVVLNQISKEVLTGLVEARQKGGALKLGADFLRGILGTFVLYAEHRPELVEQMRFSSKNFSNLIDWLGATGEFPQEVKRLKNWLQLMGAMDAKEGEDLVASAVSFAIWFEQKSMDRLGCYTEQVENFLQSVSETHRWREDLIFCSRQRLEYHLNMVGAEILNRAYRAEFLKMKRKAILLPGCIRKGLGGTCKARVIQEVLHCTGCDPACQVNEIRLLGSTYDYEVLIIPHESSAFSNGRVEPGELGIIGIACVTNLLGGGWKAKGLGMPAQCVLLDYCGCKNHWDDEGFPTAIDLDQLFKIITGENKSLKGQCMTS